jgi:hypothetical protein
MRKTPYYSIRTGKNPNATNFGLTVLQRLLLDLYRSFVEKDYFQEAFGYECVDAGEVHGTLGSDIASQFLLYLRKDNLWPITEKIIAYSEDDLFDVIEFLYDLISKPIDGYFHSYNGCGHHYDVFDSGAGRDEFRIAVNRVLVDYKEGFELSGQGEVLALAEHGLENLLAANIPNHDAENVEQRVDAAILKFRRYRSSLEDRRDAVRDLADVLEFLRPKVKAVLTTKDESDLFNIANNFGIRHHNDQQKTNYDRAIWYSWMFYYYLSTIHAALRLLEKAEQTANGQP